MGDQSHPSGGSESPERGIRVTPAQKTIIFSNESKGLQKPVLPPNK